MVHWPADRTVGSVHKGETKIRRPTRAAARQTVAGSGAATKCVHIAMEYSRILGMDIRERVFGR